MARVNGSLVRNILNELDNERSELLNEEECITSIEDTDQYNPQHYRYGMREERHPILDIMLQGMMLDR